MTGVVLAVLLAAVVAGAGFLYLAPERATRLALELRRRRAGLVRKEIHLPGGLRYAYLEGGEGEPLLLLHGFGGMKDNFADVARFLVPHFRVIIPDEIGFAESAHPPDADYSPDGQAGHLHALMRALDIGRVHLGGNSMGGQISLAYAARYPDEAASLWLLDPCVRWGEPKSEFMRWLEAGGRNLYLVESLDDYVGLIRYVMTRPPFLPRPVLEVLSRDSIRHVDLQRRIFRAMRDDTLESRIAGLETPALIVWGEQDRVFHVATAEILHGLLPNSRVVVMPGVGHVPMMERPRQSAEDYLAFRKSLDNRS